MELTNRYSYGKFKIELDRELSKTAESFVRIGYLLKVARDTNVLEESEYKSVTEFAQREYGLDKTQVSRFISINERFANGGEFLLPEYQGYGYAKLTIMLQIPEEITQELTPAYTKAEIQTVKEELEEEKKISDLEIFMEQPKEETEESLMKKTLKELGKSDPDLWEKLWKESKKDGWLDQRAMELIMAPAGDKNYSVRIMGMGRVMLTMKDGEDRVSITNTRTLEKEIYTTAEMRGIWAEIFMIDAESAPEAYRNLFGEPWPKGEVAPVQQPKKEEKEKPAKKESRVTKAKTPEKPKMSSTEPVQAAVVEEPQLPGQMTVEDFPKMMPQKEEKDDGKNDQPGMPDRTGNETPDGRSESMEEDAGDEIQSTNEIHGDAEGRGREEDFIRAKGRALRIYKELNMDWPTLWAYVDVSELRPLYNLTIQLAEALEEAINAGKEDKE